MSDSFYNFLSIYHPYINAVVILLITILIAKYSRKAFFRYLSRDKPLSGSSLTNVKFIEHLITIVIYLVGIGLAIWNIPFFKPIAQTMVAGAGIFAVAIGFASQNALGNLVSGILIVIYKPYVINDRITIRGDMRGVVEDISLRHTVIRNMENQRIIVPNSVINNEVLINSNYTDPKMMRFIEVGISYESDIDLAKQIMAEEVGNHPLCMDNRSEQDIQNGVPKVMVRVLELRDSSVHLRAWAWAQNAPDAFVLQCDTTESIKKRFDREGIVIPFPQRTVSYLNQPGKQENGHDET
jgi:small conductance mechanosensitive channel